MIPFIYRVVCGTGVDMSLLRERSQTSPWRRHGTCDDCRRMNRPWSCWLLIVCLSKYSICWLPLNVRKNFALEKSWYNMRNCLMSSFIFMGSLSRPSTTWCSLIINVTALFSSAFSLIADTSTLSSKTKYTDSGYSNYMQLYKRKDGHTYEIQLIRYTYFVNLICIYLFICVFVVYTFYLFYVYQIFTGKIDRYRSVSVKRP